MKTESPSSPNRGADRLTLRVVRVADAVGQFIEYWGFKQIHGRIWTLLALRAQPMAQTEIAQTLEVSRPLISGAVHELTHYGLVRAVGEHRNAPYEAVMDFWPTIADVLREREWMLIEGARVALEGAIEEAELEAQAGQAPRYDVDRMRLLLAMAELGQRLLRILMSMRVPKGTVDRFGGWLASATGLIGRLRQVV